MHESKTQKLGAIFLQTRDNHFYYCLFYYIQHQTIKPINTYEKEREKALAWAADRRAKAYERALHPNVFQRVGTEFEKSLMEMFTGESGERLTKYLKEAGPADVAKDVGKSLLVWGAY